MLGLLSFQACGVARITHASFDFEAICAVSSLDILLNSRELVGELIIARCPSLRERGGEARREWRAQLPSIELHTDSMGLVKAVRLGATQSLTSRRRRDILDLRDAMRFEDLIMIHIDGPTNPVDVGTKRERTDKAQVELRKTQKWVRQDDGAERVSSHWQTLADRCRELEEMRDADDKRKRAIARAYMMDEDEDADDA